MTITISETVEISARAAHQVERGGLWIFSNEIVRKPMVPSGSWVMFSSYGRSVGIGYFNPHSLIAGRVISRECSLPIEEILRLRLIQACQRRRSLIDQGSVRVVFSEADLVPGLIIDLYSGVIVLQSNTAGIDYALPILENMIPAILEKELGIVISAFVVRADSNIRSLEGVDNFKRVVVGKEASLRQGQFSESGVQYSADFVEGQKSGFFLDQRKNRAHLESLVRSEGYKSVLDLFCYSGGWGLRALYAGAQHVTFVDQSSEALFHVRKGLGLNEFPSSSAELVESDVFEFLKKDSQQYDVVVADPPAFVKSKKVLPQAKKAYEKLLRHSWAKVKTFGVLYFCSCSYHLSQQEFDQLAIDALGREKSLAHVIYRGGQAEDHPILLSMPETNYLKCMGLKKLST